MSGWRGVRGPAAVGLVAGILVWNLVFDLWLGQAERQYLWKKAAHALGDGRDVTLDGSMAVAIRDGAWVATAWTATVVAAIALASWLAYRAGRRAAAAATVRDAAAASVPDAAAASVRADAAVDAPRSA